MLIIPLGKASIMLPYRYICYRTGAVMRHGEQKTSLRQNPGREKGQNKTAL
jgi:hypothetical protein